MRKSIFALIFLLVLAPKVFASEKFISAGLNISRFYDSISKPLPGYSITFGWEWQKGRSWALIFSPSFLYRGTRLENKTVWWEGEATLLTLHIWCRRGFLDLPLFYRHYFRSPSVYWAAGLSLSLGVYDNSRTRRVSERRLPTGHYPGHYDYYLGPEDKIGYDSSIDAILAVGKKLKRFAIEGNIRMSYGAITIVDDISGINSNFMTLSLFISWYL